MNCRGLSQQEKRRDVLHFIRNTNSNVVFLQDTHISDRTRPFFNNLWKGTCYHACASSRSRGTCVLINKNIQYSLIKNINAECGNYVIVVCKISTETFAFVSIYGPNRDDPTFFKNLFIHLENIDVDHFILGGDMNFVLDPDVDCLHYKRENNVVSRQTFLHLANKLNLTDAWRKLHPYERNFTWTRKNPYQCGRLDMFFVTEHSTNLITEATIIPGYRTNHSAIMIEIEIRQEARGNGLWMLNTSHLLNDNYIQNIKNLHSEHT